MRVLPSFNTAGAALARFRRDCSGAVAIEFALIAPLLFTLLFGITVVGYYMGLSHSVQQLAAGTARASVAGIDATEREELARAYLAQASSRYPLLDSSAVTPVLTVAEGISPGMTVEIRYAVDDGLLGLANGFLKLDISDLRGQSYVGY